MGRGGGGERKPLLEKIAEPMGSAGKQHRSRLDACGLRVHPDHLVFLWVDCNGVDMFRLEILDQRHPRTLILDQKGVIACESANRFEATRRNRYDQTADLTAQDQHFPDADELGALFTS